MQKRPPDKHHGDLWEFPGGKVEQGEVPVHALVRELTEELGIFSRAQDLRPAGFAEEIRADDLTSTVILLYSTNIWRGEPRALEPGCQIDWFLPLQIASLDRPALDMQLTASLFDRHRPGGCG